MDTHLSLPPSPTPGANQGKLRSLIQRNASRPCMHPGCRNLRMLGTGSRYCRDHRGNWLRYGHPAAGPLPVVNYRYIEWRVARLFHHEDNLSRAYVSEAVGAISSLVNEACFAVSPTPLQRLLVSRVAERKAKPVDILVRCIAILLWCQQNPKVMPDDRSIEFALARSLIYTQREVEGLPPAGRVYPGATALAELGVFLRKVTAKPFAMTVHAFEQAKRRNQDPNRPFTPCLIGAPRGRRKGRSTPQ